MKLSSPNFKKKLHLARQVKVCDIWEPNEEEKVDAVLYASNVSLGESLCQLGRPGSTNRSLKSLTRRVLLQRIYD